jgi:uncharacterized protein YgbK (DUF1537 family)
MADTHALVGEVMRQLPPDYLENLLPSIRESFLRSNKTLVVLDDDPTGTQTCRDVRVLTAWRPELIDEELRSGPSILFILTNSRSMPEQGAVELAEEVGRNLRAAAASSNREVIVVSRSDSTLRGHFPAEVDAVASALSMERSVRVLVPAFIEGGRFTIGDVHYIVEDDRLIPTSETPFAKDPVFGYVHANLKQWVEEKTQGAVRADEVGSISLEEIRVGGPAVVQARLRSCRAGSVIVANAVTYRDLEVLVLALLRAEEAGASFLYRTSATFVPIRAGLPSGEGYRPPPRKSSVGGLVIVGSHVPKSTRQLNHLMESGRCHAIEVEVRAVLQGTIASAKDLAERVDQLLSDRQDVLLYTSRHQVVGENARHNLHINAQVSAYLVAVTNALTAQPAFLIAKGGITANDLASQALAAERATVLGAVIPGVPVWELGYESKFPGMSYVVFPGNVGNDQSLAEVFSIFKG